MNLTAKLKDKTAARLSVAQEYIQGAEYDKLSKTYWRKDISGAPFGDYGSYTGYFEVVGGELHFKVCEGTNPKFFMTTERPEKGKR